MNFASTNYATFLETLFDNLLMRHSYCDEENQLTLPLLRTWAMFPDKAEPGYFLFNPLYPLLRI